MKPIDNLSSPAYFKGNKSIEDAKKRSFFFDKSQLANFAPSTPSQDNYETRVDLSTKAKEYANADIDPNLPKEARIELLKNQIKDGHYKIDYDALAEKILNR